MAKKFAKKIATYAMAATMIGGAVIGSGSTGVFAAENIHLQQQPNQLIVR